MSDLDLHNNQSKDKDFRERPIEDGDAARAGIVFHNDDIFIKRHFEKDPGKAFELLFKKYYALLCNHAVRFVYSKQKAEDIVADIFMLFWNSRLYYTVKTTYRAYLFTAVRNKCYTYLKWELCKVTFEDMRQADQIATSVTPEDLILASDLHIRIEKTIKELPVKQQQVFLMSRFEGKKNGEIAAQLNLSIKTVEMHISRALSTLRKVLLEK